MLLPNIPFYETPVLASVMGNGSCTPGAQGPELIVMDKTCSKVCTPEKSSHPHQASHAASSSSSKRCCGIWKRRVGRQMKRAGGIGHHVYGIGNGNTDEGDHMLNTEYSVFRPYIQ
ncbi:uncharacterized protein MYCFIDRAFT_179507 [Pseudocercospora fijiensis CIRAD86]|uniref:Uncharacterized protein n=1 Tax=Pseudocercospora fijiensis (strain CIRAD86) TaxID=383855 RepID=M3AKR8_PSEFD|nr:uncharacterized protein MYCFIDRAFT_179507 [Pseudocercospora fijiensis CIRAD86]EME78062.1 hypothetical protein MYCFIDRAFT_179507 [Pseudocercospora fijiensis CIRAD86]